LHNLEQEPLAALSLVENRLQEVAGCRVAVPVTHCNRRPYILGNMAVVLHQPSHHVTGWHEVVIVIVDGLQLTDMADTADGCAADATHALGHNVDGLENRIGMLVEQQVIVAEVRAGQVPVEVLGLYKQPQLQPGNNSKLFSHQSASFSKKQLVPPHSINFFSNHITEEKGATTMLIGHIHLNQTHLILKDVDGSEVSLTLDDAIDVYHFVKDHLQEIEEQRQANWQEYITSVDRPDQEQ
jgi:hypothetical protein